jgi:nucleoside-diphosphate-sugar epimerase
MRPPAASKRTARYCLGKHLAEQLVYRTQQATGLPIAILRPSLVTGVAGLPWPGAWGTGP